MEKTDSTAGQAVYTPALLKLYDLGVVWATNSFIWKCPARDLLEMYNRNVSGEHLDVGVGTGYYLDHCRFPVANPRIALFDLNQNSLDTTARRLRRFRPDVYRGDVLQPLPIEPNSFQSIGLNYLLHCLPGTMETKAVVFDNLRPLLKPGGVIFGSTVLNGGVRHSAVSRRLMNVYNGRGIFSNQDDSLAALEAALKTHFDRPLLRIRGRVGLFEARI